MKTVMTATAGAIVALSGLIWSAPQSAEAQARGAPRGSYQQSCSGAYVNQGRLYADCTDLRGRPRATSIQLARCTSEEIGNDDGLLTCGRFRGEYENDRPGNGNGGNWGGGNGGGRNTITIYRDADFRGRSLTLQGAVPNLRASGFNDQISSMQFRGEWVACTDADFRGQCQTFRNNVRNLDRWGMNDRISSLRPAGRNSGY